MSNDTQTDVTSPATDPSAAPAPAPIDATPAPVEPPAASTDPVQPTPTDPAEPTPLTEPAQSAAPESYEIKAPEGAQFEPETLDELKALAKENNLSGEAAQKLADLGVKVVQKFQSRMAEQFEQTQQQWVNDSRADKEFGGDKLTENLAVAKRALDTFGTPELVKLFAESGLGNHPEVIRYNFRVAQAISEDRVVPGSTRPSGPSGAQSFYTKSQMNP